MSLTEILRQQIHRQATLQPRMALPAGRTVSLEEGYRLAKLYQEEEARVDQEELTFSKNGSNSAVNLEEDVSRKIVLLRQQQNKEANIQAAVAYAHRQKNRHSRVVNPADTEKVVEIAQKMHRKDVGTLNEAHERRQRAAGKASKKSSHKGKKHH